MATFAVGDIHGHLTPLCEILDQLRADVTADDTVVFLGDYIDRGSDTRGCVDALLAFKQEVSAAVVFLLGNHEEWMLRTMRDPSYHSWLIAMEGITAIRSYSAAAAEAILESANSCRSGLYSGATTLPYERFFDALPEAHVEFFTSLASVHETEDCVCAHAGVDPALDSLQSQGRALIWGASGFPEDYAGSRAVVYGHWNNADLDDEEWPRPRIVGNTFGLDTIAHGVLTALRLPGPTIYQSRRYERREELGRE